MAAFMAAVTGTATVCAAAPAVSDTVDAEWRRNAHRALADGVTAIGEPGVVGFVAVWGARALPVVVGRAGEAYLPIVGAGELGRGRVVAFAHDYGTMDAAQRFDTGRLLANAIRWAGEGASGPAPGATRRVGLLESDLAPFVQGSGASPLVITDRRALVELLDGGRLDVLVCGMTDPDARERASIRRFVEQGGGFLCFSCPWGWAQIHRRPVPDHPLNGILAPAGLVFTDGYAGATGAQRFLVGEGAPDPVDPVLHGGDALTLLSVGDAAQAGLSRAGRRQAGRTLEHAAAALPATDTVLRPRLRAILRERREDIVPTAARPLQRDQVLERALSAYAVGELERLPPERIRAHAAASDFPGEVPPAAPRVRRMVAVDPAIPDWQSTALYAAPGDQVVVHVREGRAPTGLRLRIGAHSDELWHLERWERVPRITQSWPMTGERLQVASPFGGLLYVEVPGQASGDALVLEIEGAVEAPHFILDGTTDEAWRSMVDGALAPWSELACPGLILTVPTDVARRITEPSRLMRHWQRVMDAAADLATIPRARRRPERIVTDRQISAGYMHSGYPIMTHLDAAAFMTDLADLGDHGWGPYHEIGHNHQSGDWTFDGTVEVTVNLFTLYILETVCGVEPSRTGRVLTEASLAKAAAHIGAGAPFDAWTQDPFLALEMYALMQRDFGWDAFKRVFAEYRDLPARERPRSDDAKRDQWLVRFSRTVERNLGPFFEAWGVPTGDAARASVADLPVWLPGGVPGLDPPAAGSGSASRTMR